MKRDEAKIKEQFRSELTELRQRIAESEARRKQLDKELKITESKYGGLIEKTGAGIAVTDLKSRFTFVNKALCKMIGYSKDDLIGKPFAEFLHPDYKKGITELFWNAFKHPGQKLHLEFKVIHKKGHSIWMYSNPTITWLKNKVVGFNAIIIDITEHKQAEEALRQSERNYKELANSITDVFFAMDEQLRNTYWNRASEELTGVSAKDAVGKHLYDLFPDTEATRMGERMYLKVLRTKKPQHFVNEYSLGGKAFVFDISAYPSGDGISVFVKDITGRKRMQDTLWQSEENYRMLFERSPIGITTLDMKGVIKTCNDAVCVKSGYSKDDFIGKHFSKVSTIRAGDTPKFMKMFASLIRGEIPKPIEVMYTRKDGTTGWTETHISLLKLSGKRIGIQVIQNDITERKQAEEALRGSEEKYR